MKKYLKYTLYTIIGFIVLIFACSLWLSQDEYKAEHPKRIAAISGFDLPDYTVKAKSDNMDRSASAWSEYDWKVQLKKPLTEKQLDQLKRLVKTDSRWSYNKEEKQYEFCEDTDEAEVLVFVSVAGDNLVTLCYAWWDFFS